MDKIISIWNYLVNSNAFNFAIMVLLFVWFDKKVNFADKFNDMIVKVKESIDKSSEEKANAKLELNQAKDAVKNLDNEIQEKLDNAKTHSETLAQKIIEETEAKVKQIEENIQRVLEAEEKTISSRLTSRAVSDSVLRAKDKIKNLLDKNPQLHEKYINESIASIDRINY